MDFLDRFFFPLQRSFKYMLNNQRGKTNNSHEVKLLDRYLLAKIF